MTGLKRKASEGIDSVTGWTADSDQSAAAFVLFNELVASRDRLASLPPLTPQDLERVEQAMHEVIWYFLTPPQGRRTELPLPEPAKTFLLKCARNRALDLYVATVALVAQKLAASDREPSSLRGELAALRDGLDALTFDHRATKTSLLAVLRDLRKDLDERIAHVASTPPKGYRFAVPPEKYKSRKKRSEKPDQFFGRVYAAHVPRGLTQADIRRADPAFYNVLHVWCSRHEKKLSGLVPATRTRRG
ncbi:hypothetical protein [Bradyrhizobium sp. WSM2254]|uniref:hypothetical protein n=1 Tax=Bradyrhizobium sp. WSM2254 TaxID=1188263 RepID=UPI0006763BAB|nr:hypothetical protein [Bradyrhizobium sp. WSM2254]